MTNEYLNISDRYGDELPVTIDDYQELNPDGEFEAEPGGIFEHMPTGHWELIAIAIEGE